MTASNEYIVAQRNTRLQTNRVANCKLEIPGDLPGVVIFLHGVNDPGASYESVETGLCQGLNERLDRPDLQAGRYGAAYAEAKATPSEQLREEQRDLLDDPDTNLYQRTESDKTRSVLIPFYWEIGRAHV